MTIPMLPSPWGSLGQGLNNAYDAYNAEKEKQYQEAQTGARLIIGLMQAGRIDPSVISDPSFQQTLQAAKIPVPPQSAVVPSSAAERERATVGIARGTEKPNAQRMITLGVPGTGSQIGEEDFKKGLMDVKNAALSDPSVARLLAEVMTPDVAQAIETARSANAVPQDTGYAAKHFVALAGQNFPVSGVVDQQVLIQRAMDAAGRDPQWAPLIASGQLGAEHFAEAAREYALLNEDQRIKWADAYARQIAARSRLDDFYDSQRKAYDVQIGQLQNWVKLNPLDTQTLAFLNTARKKLSANPNAQLSEFERRAIQSQVQYNEALGQIQTLQKERQDIIDRGINAHNPVDPNAVITPPIGAGPAARRSVPRPPPETRGGATIRGGGTSTAAPRVPGVTAPGSSSISVRERGSAAGAPPARNQGESDADYWDRLVEAGIQPDRATAIVTASRGAPR